MAYITPDASVWSRHTPTGSEGCADPRSEALQSWLTTTRRKPRPDSRSARVSNQAAPARATSSWLCSMDAAEGVRLAVTSALLRVSASQGNPERPIATRQPRLRSQSSGCGTLRHWGPSAFSHPAQ